MRIEREIARRGIIQRGVGAELIGPCPVALRRWGTAESSWMQSLLCGPLRTAARVALFGTVGYLCEVFAVRDDAGTKRQGILVFPEWGAVGEYTERSEAAAVAIALEAWIADNLT